MRSAPPDGLEYSQFNPGSSGGQDSFFLHAAALLEEAQADRSRGITLIFHDHFGAGSGSGETEFPLVGLNEFSGVDAQEPGTEAEGEVLARLPLSAI